MMLDLSVNEKTTTITLLNETRNRLFAMSYRTFKRLLGETSLERKCRFLFGGGLMLLISGSFYFYARLNDNIIKEQNVETARMLVSTIVLEKHLKVRDEYSESTTSNADDQDATEEKTVEVQLQEMAQSLKPGELQKAGRWAILGPDPAVAQSVSRPADEIDNDALLNVKSTGNEFTLYQNDIGVFRYYAPLKAQKSCIDCHTKLNSNLSENDLMGIVKITLPLSSAETKRSTNNALLLATAIVTSLFAMIAAYAIVRYVIVKPVLHLKDISDQIARGDLDQRADIRTGDEFEELSHAFNRMLRHLVNTQDELRDANTQLDGKVDELAQANLSLFEMNKLKNEFLATMSHELRTPLNSILGFSDVLESSENLNDRQRKFARNITSSGKNLLALINDILDLAKIESGKMQVHPVEVNLIDLVEDQISLLMPQAEKKNIALVYKGTPDLPTARQDAGKLLQILNNLLSNAVKFTPDGGRVEVRVNLVESNVVEIVVEDTGIGIPLEDQNLIFEKFRQASTKRDNDAMLTREYEGTGLGLSIVRELSRLLGGDVQLESEFGKGSIFSVRIPLQLAGGDISMEDVVHSQTILRTKQRIQDYHEEATSS